MKRLDYNREIIGKLSELIESQPDSRFGQILFNYVLKYHQPELGQIHIDDPFYEEPEITLKRINEKMLKYGKQTKNNY